MYRYSEMDVGEGWRPIVKVAIQEIERLGGNIVQIKEKFGGLRIYYHNGDHEKISEIIKNAEKACASICEECGEPGQLYNKNGWLKTVCPKHEKVENDKT